MPVKIAINGYGRIGRNVLRALYELQRRDQVQLVAINDLADLQSNVHLTRYDSTHGRFQKSVEVDGNDLVVDGDLIKVCSEPDLNKLPWGALDVDVVLECTGRFTHREKAQGHLRAGAKKVLISAPGQEVDATVVYGVNHQGLASTDQVVSNASCTTNCLVPLVKPLHEAVGIESGLMTTIHAYTNDQMLVDSYHPDIRRARAAAVSMIPTKTGAAKSVGLVLPELAGKLDGYAVRVPTLNVSLVDLTFLAARETSREEVDVLLKNAAEGELTGILSFNDEPLVSVDYNHSSYSSNYDATQTRVMDGRLVKVIAWYDNEWGFSCRMLDTALAMASL